MKNIHPTLQNALAPFIPEPFDTGLPDGVRLDGPVDAEGRFLQFTDYAEGPACGATFSVAARHADRSGILAELLTMRKKFENRGAAQYTADAGKDEV